MEREIDSRHASSLVAMPLMISTNGMTGTGFMKCMPTCILSVGLTPTQTIETRQNTMEIEHSSLQWSGKELTTWLDRFVTAAILVIEIELVLEARIASGFTICTARTGTHQASLYTNKLGHAGTQVTATGFLQRMIIENLRTHLVQQQKCGLL